MASAKAMDLFGGIPRVFVSILNFDSTRQENLNKKSRRQHADYIVFSDFVNIANFIFANFGANFDEPNDLLPLLFMFEYISE